ncbi:MAG: Hint domain-containing protein [Rhodobacterales bacterium]|nr:Hint domain-containing protein [Rhodobacterales bacterium]
MEPRTVAYKGGVTPSNRRNQIPQGLVAGSIILTLDGEVAVEDITVGARVITRDSGMALVRRVAVRQLRCDVVRIKAGSLGHTRPDRDVTVMAGQKILVRDWRAKAVFSRKTALVAARDLVDGEFVTLQNGRFITVFEIEFDAEHILYADGVEVASFEHSAAVSQAA